MDAPEGGRDDERFDRDDDEWHHEVHVDRRESGFFLLRALPAVPVRVQVIPWGWGTAPEGIDYPSGLREVAIPPDGLAHCEFSLEPQSGVINGRCVRDDGGGDAGRFVVAEAAGGELFVAHTSGDGSYEIEVPDIGLAYEVRAGRAVDAPVVPGVLPGRSGVDFVLPNLILFGLLVLDRETGEVPRSRVLVSLRQSGTEGWDAILKQDRLPGEDYLLLSTSASVVDLQVECRGFTSRMVEGVHLKLDGSSRLSLGLDPER